jgi:hypothetical protein
VSRLVSLVFGGGGDVLHFRYVGHFDPRDFLDLSARPCRPKVQRPLSREAAERVLAGFDLEVAEYVWYDEAGYVTCGWAQAPHRLWDSIHRFALALAEAEGAVVMNEPPGWLIEYPEEARRAQEEFWADWAARPRVAPGPGGG